MKELQNILKKLRQISSENVGAVLATVVDVRGSSYRLPGAKMLILDTGETVGTVSGGCLEADVMERAKRVLKTNEPQIFVYDTTDAEDSVFSLNMGCRGVIRILLEPARESDYLNFVEKCFDARQTGVAATLIGASDGTKLKTGQRFFFNKTETHRNSVGGEFEEQVFADAQAVLETERSLCKTYQTANGAAEFFIEIVKPPLNLIVFGAGADAVPLVELGKNLGWRVAVVDHRAAFANMERFPAADEILLSRTENAGDNLAIDEDSVAVVMTHNYERDREILKFLSKSAARYVGVLGPKRRTESLLQELTDAGEVFAENELSKLYAPVGLDIGADTPETIALSIVAEINSVLAGRAAGFLRNRNGSIYGRSEN
jgi:xanthine dehydrogenase accessory factor